MESRNIWAGFFLLIVHFSAFAQNFNFNFNGSGRRVCLVSTEVDIHSPYVKVILHDSLSNNSESITILRRVFTSYNWESVALDLPAGTGHWIDNDVMLGEVWEYQVRRKNTWSFQSNSYDAIGYTIGAVMNDNSTYKGQMILLVSNDVYINLPDKYAKLKKDLTADGWFVNELVVDRATDWDSGAKVVTIKNQIVDIYDNASMADKPKVLYILGHVPLPRCGSSDVNAPDDHSQNKGARGCDVYYADIDGIFTDTATYNPSGLATPLASNIPGDFKWDQDFFPSDVEMTFGRIDFADLMDISTPEMTLIASYLDRSSSYKHLAPGYDMGDKSAFYFGYDNSNDGAFRTLPNISKPTQVYENYVGANHNEWVQENGPFKIYMQNRLVPEINDWKNFGMNATVYASDQSYWGFGDVPQTGVYSRIRSLLGVESKCLVSLWTTTGINIFHQACLGKPLSLALRDIMNHNETNQYLEKPPQQYDTQSWWNRTHFAFYGDPTINLFQVAPPTNLTLAEYQGNAILKWKPVNDLEVIGYHIYYSDSELGKYERITDIPIDADSSIISNYQEGSWYMVKAIKVVTSGCGTFLHGSHGETIQASLILNTENASNPQDILIFPNPANEVITIESPALIKGVEVLSVMGKPLISIKDINTARVQLDISKLQSNVYILKLSDTTKDSVYKIVKSAW